MNSKRAFRAHAAPHRHFAVAASFYFALLSVVTSVPASAAYEVISVTNGGAINGIVSLAGDAPVSKAIKVTKNQEFCGNTILDPTFSVDRYGGLDNAVVYLQHISQGKAPEAEPAKLLSKNCMIVPRVQGAMIGMQVEFSSNDPILHNMHSQHADTNATIYNVALPFAGVSMSKPLPITTGLIKVKSDAQEWMHAWIVELDNPYYATTGPDGRFTIRDVPPGNYTLVIWHESAGESSIPVVVAAGQQVEADVSVKAN